jgi:lysozyme
MNISKLLEFEEGFKSTPYYCSAGFPTIGIGWRIGERAQPLHDFKMMRICKAAAYAQLEFEIASIIAKIEGFIPSFKDLNEPRQAVLISMAYQMGIGGLMKFKKMLAAIDCLDWDAAAAEGLNSKWARQTPERAKRQMKTLLLGDWSQYECL